MIVWLFHYNLLIKTNLFLENPITLEIRLTCSLVWHLLNDNEELQPNDKVYYLFWKFWHEFCHF
jgi:hypothetical protein